MASQPAAAADANLAVAEFNSFIRGYHVYRQIWNPVVGELLLLKRERNSIVDLTAVAVKKEDEVVGHVPHNIAAVISHFLGRDCNKGFVEVTGGEVNRGAGYGLEIPCIYRLYGPKLYTDRVIEIVDSLKRNGLL